MGWRDWGREIWEESRRGPFWGRVDDDPGYDPCSDDVDRGILKTCEGKDEPEVGCNNTITFFEGETDD